ncbi:MAG: prephenate dehydrogenase/arogenate dehydrogenase family protein, partial [Deltaproteobacteria bacterium]|nr:prephenate dehydrogenase/arogenate dehydrogenase family protein [Deltaproteobacteria bacterium]
ALWAGVGMRIEEMDMYVHDQVLARVSHLPHIIAFSVMNAMRAAHLPGVDPLAYAGSAFDSLTRVAASPVEMWRDICQSNRDALLAALTEFEAALAQMKAAIANGDKAALSQAMNDARTERHRLTKLREKK